MPPIAPGDSSLSWFLDGDGDSVDGNDDSVDKDGFFVVLEERKLKDLHY